MPCLTRWRELAEYFADGPPGQKVNSFRWLQKKVMEKARVLPRDFSTVAEWEIFRTRMREELPRVIGIPTFPSMKESFVRGRTRLGEDVIVERVDVYVDDDYAIPSFVFSPAAGGSEKIPALMWNPGWPQDKFQASYQKFAERMAKQGYVVLIPDHAPFGESSLVGRNGYFNCSEGGVAGGFRQCEGLARRRDGWNRPVLLAMLSREGIQELKGGVTGAPVRAMGQF